MTLKHLILSVATAALWAGQATAQPSLADQKLQADLDAVRLKAELDKQNALRDAFAVVRGMTSGAATIDKPELTAEGLLLTRRLYSGAAAQLADATGFPGSSAPLVVFGSSPPSVGDWYAFREVTTRLGRNLDTAADDWRRAVALEGQSGTSKSGQALFAAPAVAGALPAIGLALNGLTTVASLFKVDTAVSGVNLTFGDAQLNSILVQELVANGFRMEPALFAIPGPPTNVEAMMTALELRYAPAHKLYHEEYVTRLAKAKKVENLNAAVALAGKQLEVVLGDFETLRRNLYTPIGGVLPATILEWQKKLAGDPNRPVVYIRNHKAALTSTTQRGVLTSLSRKVPTFFNAAAEIDYVLMNGERMVPGSILCIAPRVRLPEVAKVVTTCERPILPGTPIAAAATATKPVATAEGQ